MTCGCLGHRYMAVKGVMAMSVALLTLAMADIFVRYARSVSVVLKVAMFLRRKTVLACLCE